MRILGIALTLGALMGLYTGANGVPREFAPYRFLQTRIYDGRYNVQFHRKGGGRDVLMALDQKRLNLVTFDINKVRTINEERLIEKNQSPEMVKTLGARNGAFWVAFVRKQKNGRRDIELHSDNSQEYFAIEDSGTPLSLELVEAGNEILLVAVYPQSINVYSRYGHTLRKITEMAAPALIRRAQAFATREGSLIVVTLDADHQLRVYDGGEGLATLEPRWRKTVQASFMEATLEEEDNLIIALVSGNEHGDRVWIYSEKSKKVSPYIPVQLGLGRIQWLRSENGQLRLAAMRTVNQRTVIQLIQPGGEVRTIGAGDAKNISDLASFQVGRNEYLVYLKDHRDVYLQGEDATSVIRPTEEAREVRLSPLGRIDGGQEVIAIMTDYKRSTQVQIIGFARPREIKPKKLIPLRMVGN